MTSSLIGFTTAENPWLRQHYLRELRESLSDSRCSWVLDKSRPHFEGVERVE